MAWHFCSCNPASRWYAYCWCGTLLWIQKSASPDIPIAYALTQLFSFFFLNILFIYLRETAREWEGTQVRGRSRLPTEQEAWCRARSQDPGIHDLSQRQRVNQLRHPGAPGLAHLVFSFPQYSFLLEHIMEHIIQISIPFCVVGNSLISPTEASPLSLTVKSHEPSNSPS